MSNDTEVRTGIYRRRKQFATLEQLQEIARRQDDVLGTLAEWERYARNVLRRHRIRRTPQEVASAWMRIFGNLRLQERLFRGRRKRKTELGIPSDAPPEAQDAFDLLGYAQAARDKIQAGQSIGADMAHLGRLFERLTIRPTEPHAKRGRKVIAGARAAHVETHGTRDAPQRRDAQIRESWQRTREDHPRLSMVEIDVLVGRQFDLSGRTVRGIRLKKIEK